MLCVECGSPVASLYTHYSPDNIRATVCAHCHKFADKYIEYDAVLIGIDLLLLRPQAMRHLIFNVLSPAGESRVVAATWRMHLVLTLFDIYIHWAWAEQSADPRVLRFLGRTSAVHQYLAFSAQCLSNALVLHAVAWLLARALVPSNNSNALSIAILLASGAKLLPLLTLIWQYELAQVLPMIWYVIGIVLVEVLAEALGFGYLRAAAVTAGALGVRWLVTERLLAPWLLQTG